MTIFPMFLCAAGLLAAQTPTEDLLNAIKDGHGDQVQSMLDARPELVTAKAPSGVSAILMAVYTRHPDIAEMFAARGAKLSMAEACALGRTERGEKLRARESGPA